MTLPGIDMIALPSGLLTCVSFNDEPCPDLGETALNKVALVDDLGEIKRLLAGNESGRLQGFEDVGEARFRDRQIF